VISSATLSALDEKQYAEHLDETIKDAINRGWRVIVTDTKLMTEPHVLHEIRLIPPYPRERTYGSWVMTGDNK
jgi:hypothetical protein